MKCFLDLDGVLADFVGAAVKAHGRPNPYEEYLNSLGIFEIEKVWGITAWEFWAKIDLLGVDFWANLEKTSEADHIVYLAEEKFGRDNCCILTAPSNSPACYTGKLKWVNKYYPDYHKKVIFGNAKRFLASPEACLIDDRDKNVEEFRAAGGKAILVPRPWNKDYAEPFVLGTVVTRLENL